MIAELIERKTMTPISLKVNARPKKPIYIKEPRRTSNDRVKPDKTNLEYASEYAEVLAFMRIPSQSFRYKKKAKDLTFFDISTDNAIYFHFALNFF